jgi:hypothetical protein
MRRNRNQLMRLDPKDIKDGLDELLTLDDIKLRIGARHIIRNTKEYIRQLEGELRRAGFTEYNDPKDKESN